MNTRAASPGPAVEPKPIERIRPPTQRHFEHEYMRRHRPVVLMGLFKGQPIDRVKTLEHLRARYADLPVGYCPEYFGNYRETGYLGGGARRRDTLGGYLDLIAREPDTQKIVSEWPTPPAVQALFEVPKYCAFRYREAAGVKSDVFLGNRGNFAHLHFDHDQAHVLLHQVVGRKRVVLIDPRRAGLLAPILNISTLSLEHLPEPERARQVASHDGYDFVLHPGETVYIPPLYWHYIEYLDTGLSVNFRYGCSPRSRFLGTLHANMWLQNVSVKMEPHDQLKGELRKAYLRMLRTARSRHASGFAKYQTLQRLFEDLFTELCSDAVPASCWLDLRDRVDVVVRSRIRMGGLYPDARKGAPARRVGTHRAVA